SVPDEWKENFFGSADALEAMGSADADGDGLSNRDEYIAGSDPTKADWRFTSQNGVFTLRWAGEAGAFYTVEKRTPNSSNWVALSSHMEGQDAFLQYSENIQATQAYFYRVRREP